MIKFFRTFFTLLGAFALLVPTQAESLKPLEVEFPPPFLIGTPVPIKVPHLEAPNAEPAEVLVPAGVTNLAAGKEVTSSSEFLIIGELDFITDGDKFSEEGYFVELDTDLQWVQIDLGEAAELYATAVWHFHSQKRVYHDVIVQVSNDPDFVQGVTTVFNNDHDDSAGMGRGSDKAYIETNQGKLIPLNKIKARYIRLYSQGNTSDALNHYVEVEVFGR
ncbi:MAG: hypothetical protein SynsKO_34970 [Synoicihabitans sp.]